MPAHSDTSARLRVTVIGLEAALKGKSIFDSSEEDEQRMGGKNGTWRMGEATKWGGEDEGGDIGRQSGEGYNRIRKPQKGLAT